MELPSLDDLRESFGLTGWSDSDLVKEFSRVTGMDQRRAAEAFGFKMNEPGFVSSVKGALGGRVKGAGELAADVAGLFGADLKDNALVRYGEDVEFANQGDITSFQDLIDRPWDAFKQSSGMLVGAVGPELLTAFVTGGLGGVATAAKAATTAGSTASKVAGAVAKGADVVSKGLRTKTALAAGPFISEYGGIKTQQEEAGMDVDSMAALALRTLGAGANAFIEVGLGVQPALIRALKEAPTEAGRAMALEALKKHIRENFGKTPLRTAAKGAFKVIAGESAEEAPQTLIGYAASLQDPTSPEALKEAALSSTMAALGSIPFGGIYGTRQALRQPSQEAIDIAFRQTPPTPGEELPPMTRPPPGPQMADQPELPLTGGFAPGVQMGFDFGQGEENFGLTPGGEYPDLAVLVGAPGGFSWLEPQKVNSIWPDDVVVVVDRASLMPTEQVIALAHSMGIPRQDLGLLLSMGNDAQMRQALMDKVAAQGYRGVAYHDPDYFSHGTLLFPARGQPTDLGIVAKFSGEGEQLQLNLPDPNQLELNLQPPATPPPPAPPLVLTPPPGRVQTGGVADLPLKGVVGEMMTMLEGLLQPKYAALKQAGDAWAAAGRPLFKRTSTGPTVPEYKQENTVDLWHIQASTDEGHRLPLSPKTFLGRHTQNRAKIAERMNNWISAFSGTYDWATAQQTSDIPDLDAYLNKADHITATGIINALIEYDKSHPGSSYATNVLIPHSVLEPLARDAWETLTEGDIAFAGLTHYRDLAKTQIGSGVAPSEDTLRKVKVEELFEQTLTPLLHYFLKKYAPDGKLVVSIDWNTNTDNAGYFMSLGEGVGFIRINAEVHQLNDIAYEIQQGRPARAKAKLAQYKAKVLDTALHEGLGHYLFAHVFDKQPQWVKDAIYAEYIAWLKDMENKTFGEMIDTTGVKHDLLLTMSETTRSQSVWSTVWGRGPSYWLNFDEYIARRMGDLLSKRILLNEVNPAGAPFWRTLTSFLKRLFREAFGKYYWKNSSLEMFIDSLSLANKVAYLRQYYAGLGGSGLVDPTTMPEHPDYPGNIDALDSIATEAKPVVPWMGGKRWLSDEIARMFKVSGAQRFVDLFSGGGAISIAVGPERGLAIDRNPHIINLYRQIQDGAIPKLRYPDTPEGFAKAVAHLNALVKKGQATGTEASDLFYHIASRALYGKVQLRADNGIVATFGAPKRDTPDFSSVAESLSGVEFVTGDFKYLTLPPNSFVYADPPYHQTGRSYTTSRKAFGWDDQVALAKKLAAHQGPVVISNSGTDEIVDLYRSLGFTIQYIHNPRAGAVTSKHQEILATKGLDDGVTGSASAAVATSMSDAAVAPHTARWFASMNRVFGTALDVDTMGRGQARFNSFMRWMLSLPQIERENWNVPGVMGFADAARAWWGTKGKWTAEFDNWLDLVRTSGFGKAELTKLWKFADEVTLLSDKLNRKLTEEEKAIEAAKLGGLSPELLELWKSGRELLQRALNEMEIVTKERTRAFWERAIAKEENPFRRLEIEAARDKALDKVTKDFRLMRNRDYWPLARFGTFTVNMVAKEDLIFLGQEYKEGQEISFELFETETEQLARKAELVQAYSGRVTVSAGKVDESVYGFMNLPPSVLQMIENEMLEAIEDYKTDNTSHNEELMNVVNSQLNAIRTAMQHLTPEHAFQQRMLRRKGTRGFSNDGLRAMASTGQSFAGHIARAKHRGQMDAALKELNLYRREVEKTTLPGWERQGNKLGDLYNYLRRAQKDMMNPGDDWANLRAAGFLYHLGAVVRSAVVQVAQPVLTTYPFLATRYGDAVAVAEMSKGYKALRALFMRQEGAFRPDLLEALKLATENGTLNQSLFTEIAAVAEGSNIQRLLPGKFLKSERAAGTIRKASYYASWMFQKGEELNRLVTFRAAYELEIKKLLGNPADIEAALAALPEAERAEIKQLAYHAGRFAVDQTQGEYARYARPEFMRGKKSAVFLFKMYQQVMSYFAFRDPGAIRFWLVQMMIAGSMGAPFAEDLLDIIEMLTEKLGLSDGDLRSDARNYIRGVGLDPELIMHGLARVATPWDLSANMSLGRIVPMVDPLTRSMMPGSSLQDNAMRAQQEALGALFSIPLNWMTAVSSGEERDYERAMPTVVRDIYRTYRRVREGGEVNRAGVMMNPIDWSDPIDVATHLGQAFGFRPAEIAQEQEMSWAQRSAASYWAGRHTALTGQYYHLFKQGTPPDREALADVRAAINAFNASVPYPEMKISGKMLQRGRKEHLRRDRAVEMGVAPEKKYRRLYSEIAEGFGVESSAYR